VSEVPELTGACVIAGNVHMELSIARPHHESSVPDNGEESTKSLQRRLIRRTKSEETPKPP
jgi:hypothetical protein